jgi:hypothetical protein
MDLETVRHLEKQMGILREQHLGMQMEIQMEKHLAKHWGLQKVNCLEKS